MPVFQSKSLDDEEIWSRLEAIAARRDRLRDDLARPEVSTDPERLPALARELAGLDEICLRADELKRHLHDQAELEGLRAAAGAPDDGELEGLCRENAALCARAADGLYRLLLEKGHLDEEQEDETDLKILRFIDYAGPEYAGAWASTSASARPRPGSGWSGCWARACWSGWRGPCWTTTTGRETGPST